MPPPSFFCIVWTILYICMGYASYLVWHEGQEENQAWLPLTLYAIQLLLNWAWPVIFYRAQKFDWVCLLLYSYASEYDISVDLKHFFVTGFLCFCLDDSHHCSLHLHFLPCEPDCCLLHGALPGLDDLCLGFQLYHLET